MGPQRKRLRCPIYTRKSSEEGLEQAFNSLAAQREACIAFIHSQRHEGWRVLEAHYDDGGYSGATLERPALQCLLADIAAGKLDCVVIYKLDRLTRALTDFAKMVEALDAGGIGWVSLTQQFNTTSSMGRLTLNVLLSFAQFEREVTAERIRDKFAASKRKGLWMGGRVPLGYDLKERQLRVTRPRRGFARMHHVFATRTLPDAAAYHGLVVQPLTTIGLANGTIIYSTASQAQHAAAEYYYLQYMVVGPFSAALFKVQGYGDAISQKSRFDALFASARWNEVAVTGHVR